MHWTVRPTDADGMANYVDADQTATSSSDQVCTAPEEVSVLFAQNCLSQDLGTLCAFFFF